MAIEKNGKTLQKKAIDKWRNLRKLKVEYMVSRY
jgi:hypothetical protein